MPPPDYQVRTIPKTKALHFVTKSNKDNPEGRSVLRSCYRDWYFKKRIQEFEGIGVERDLVGLPILTPPEGVDIWDDSNPNMSAVRSIAELLVKNIRRDAKEGVVIPGGWKLELLSSGGQRQLDVGKIIERYDTRIAMTVLADFVFLGHQHEGSFALSSDKTELFSVALGTFMNIICDVFNSQAIPQLIQLNGSPFKGISDFPHMVHSDVEKQDVEKFINGVTSVVNAGILTPTEELAKTVCHVLDLPEPVISESVPQMAHNPKSNKSPGEPIPDLESDLASEMEAEWLGEKP